MPNAPFLAPERDPTFKLGRAKSAGTTYLSIPGIYVGAGGQTFNPPANQDNYAPWFTSTPIVIDQLVIEISSLVAGNIRFGFYAADTDWQPIGAPLADSGSITSSAAVLTYTPGTPIILSRGRYLSVMNQSSQSSLRTARGAIIGSSFDPSLGASPTLREMFVGRAFAAFPTPGTAWTTSTGISQGVEHYVYYRITKP
jgi:hypothetical protein